MTEKKFKALLEKYMNNTCTPAEKQKVDDFFDRMQKGGISPREIRNDIALQDKIRKKISEKTPHTFKEKRKRRFSLPRIAAVIALFIISAASIIYLKRNDRHITRIAEKGQQLKVVLSDSSIAYLNSGSRLSFPEAFKKSYRTVKLDGEAYFEIRKNKKSPFVVMSGPIRTEVLGTSFVVSNYGDTSPSVTVASGKVKVSTTRKKPVYLVKNERVTLDTIHQKLIKESVEASRYTSWIEGKIVFNHTGLSEVAAILGRRFNVSIRITSPSYEGCTINGSYSGKNLKDILKSLRFIYGITYQIRQNGHIDLFTKPCSTQN